MKRHLIGLLVADDSAAAPPSDEAEGHGIRVGRETEDDDAEGHRFKFGAPDTDQAPSDEADTEGHKRHFGRAAPDTDEPPSDDDAEGHIRRQ